MEKTYQGSLICCLNKDAITFVTISVDENVGIYTTDMCLRLTVFRSFKA